jgi:nucleoid DNA-binding protein
MNKPISMSVREWIVKKMSIKMMLPHKIIDSVVTHQFDSANDALNVNKSVEISGFGKFYFNDVKAVKHYNKMIDIKKAYENMLLDDTLSATKRKNITVRLESATNSIKSLKPKINEP